MFLDSYTVQEPLHRSKDLSHFILINLIKTNSHNHAHSVQKSYIDNNGTST